MEGAGDFKIPVIDLESEDQEECRKLIKDACTEWGCFRVVNHNIPLPLLSEMKSVVRSLFDIPPEIKHRNVDVIPGSGYMAPNKDNPLYEALGLYDLGSPQAVQLFCSQLELPPQQRETILKYSGALHELAVDLGGKLAECMGVTRDAVKGWPCQFRINKYNFTKETVGSTGVMMHTDSGFLTILQDDECVGGLEIMGKSGESFLPIHPMPGTLLVNLGDIATVWSNGTLHNVKHRVQCKEATERISIALFLLGPKDTVEVPPELVDSNHPRLFVPFSYEDYRRLRISTESQAGEALQLLHVNTQQLI